VKSFATARKSFKKFQEIVKKVFDDKALKRTQIQAIINRQRRETGGGRSEKAENDR
jgi:hypothetical protein